MVIEDSQRVIILCDLCKTWNLSETASCFDVSLRVNHGRPLAVCSTGLISGASKQSVKCGYSNSSQLAKLLLN